MISSLAPTSYRCCNCSRIQRVAFTSARELYWRRSFYRFQVCVTLCCSYTSHDNVSTPRGTRACCSAIIYALLPTQVSKLHRIRSDEMWHHYSGPSLEVIELNSSAPGHVRTTVLGKCVAAPHCNQLQHVVKAGTWFCARVQGGAAVDSAPAVVGCTVSPGFDFADFTMGDRRQLLRLCVLCHTFGNNAQL